MSGLTLINELNDMQSQLSEGVRLMAKYGRELAQAEYNYKVALSERALKMRADDVPVTLINTTVYGDKAVAKRRLERDIADAMYQTSKENINALKLKIRVLQAQVDKEWSTTS